MNARRGSNRGARRSSSDPQDVPAGGAVVRSERGVRLQRAFAPVHASLEGAPLHDVRLGALDLRLDRRELFARSSAVDSVGQTEVLACIHKPGIPWQRGVNSRANNVTQQAKPAPTSAPKSASVLDYICVHCGIRAAADVTPRPLPR